ncbi:MAG: membrane protein insertase YidC [Polyangiaceae bacterium]
MDRSFILRVALISLLGLVAYKYLFPAMGLGGKSESSQAIAPEAYADAPGFAPDTIDPLPAGQKDPVVPPEGTLCNIKGDRFDAVLSTRGAALTHFRLRDPQYAGVQGLDLVTTDHERWRPLRTLFRGAVGKGLDQVAYDRFDWKLEGSDEKSCTFSYTDDTVHIEKVVAANDRPFELDVKTTLTNVTDQVRSHRFSIEAFAYHTNKEVKGGMGRVSPFATELSCARGKDVTRKPKTDFKEGWFSAPIVDRYVAISNAYFADAIIPVVSPESIRPECDLLAEDWYTYGQKPDDDQAGAVYHARLQYPAEDIKPKGTATYEQVAFFGPKEREVLAKAGGGSPGLGDIVNLGFFSPVAKVLVGVLVFFRTHVTGGNWGLAIIAMTVSLRLILLPLSIKPVKTAIAMRKLKPEIDALGLKFKDDAQAKSMATMELYRKHGVNPLGGCLPQLVQMPIWIAMYTTLQTAVEMYHERFLWFTDLSAPDKFFILPLVIGGFMIVQQRIVPQQGMDPVQAKMMMWMLPAVFTVMMLFLPAALGVYMLTNSILGITQQLVIERIAPRGGPPGAPSDASGITVKPVAAGAKKGDDGPLDGTFGKGKARV